jgi:hypothetical protein
MRDDGLARKKDQDPEKNQMHPNIISSSLSLSIPFLDHLFQ